MIGEVLGSYRIIAKLGAGGMGTVWLAEHQLLGSRAAIKVLLPELSSQEQIVQRFFDEARAATRIRDPGIVTVLDFGRHDGDAYLVMELLTGETLTQRLGTGTLAPKTAVRYIQLAALAMAAAHARGIIHRDLKPDNLFVVADPAVPGGERIKILDFGIAKLIDRRPDDNHQSTVTGAIMGTPAYMSPEQCRGAGGIDHRTDIYALGCVLFQLLTGRPPFIAPTPGDMIASHLREDPPVPSAIAPGLSPELDALVLRCLAKDPDARFANMTELVRAGAAITGDNLVVATIPPLRPSEPIEGAATQVSLAPSLAGPMPVHPPVTTLSAGAVSTNSPPTRSRTPFVLAGALLIVGGLVAAFALHGGHEPARTVVPAGDAAARPDAMLVAPPIDATIDATILIDGPRATTSPHRDAGAARVRKPDAAEDDFSHR
ncbi:MAG: serine/threonine-protein kinase [Kofleriaceae bacterium]